MGIGTKKWSRSDIWNGRRVSHDPIYTPRFIHKVNQGFDVVIGSRRIKGKGCWLGLVSKIDITGVGILLGGILQA